MTISIDDRHLVESYQAGDTHAFADLVEAYTPALLGHAIRRLGDRAAAEDAVQETFVRAFRALARFDGDYRVGPWLHRILINVCNDEGNRRRREADKFDRFAADPFAADLAPGVEDELGLDVDLDVARLDDALQSLPANYRQALSLRFVDELPYDEVARVAGVSEQNARARVSRARSAARAALRGVAAIPMLLIPALRRTESVAAAATHSDAVRLASDTVVASSPFAAPLVTKAVVGFSVIAAIATPADGPSVIERSRALSMATPVVQEAASVEAPAPTLVVPQSAGLAPLDSGAGAESSDTATPASSDPVAPSDSNSSDPAGSDAVALPAGGTTPVPLPSDDADAPASDEPTPVPTASAGVLTLSGLTVTVAGPRLDIAGDASLVVGDRTLAGTVSGRISYTDQVDVRRFNVALILLLEDGSTVDLRVQAQGRAVATQGDLELAEVTAFDLAGPFRAAGPASVGLLDAGNATGALDLGLGTFSLKLG